MPTSSTSLRAWVTAVAWSCISVGQALALAEEELGNKPVRDDPAWNRGVVAVVNHECRVRRVWVNGNEFFHFAALGGADGKADAKAGTAALNQALADFALVAGPVREVVFLPGRGQTKTFDGTVIPVDWSLQVPGGLYLGRARAEKDTNVYVKHPTMMVYVGHGPINLDQVRVPKGVAVLDVGDLLDRCLAGLKSAEHDVRGWAVGRLGELGPDVEEVLPALIRMVDDKHEYVRRYAAGVLGSFGVKAAAALPALRSRGLSDKESNVKLACRDAAAAIEAGAAGAAAQDDQAKRHRAVRARIGEWKSGPHEPRP